MRTRGIIHSYLLTLIFLFADLCAMAQLSAADSVLFGQWFNGPLYASNPATQDNFYIHENIQSITGLNNQLASVFKFSHADFKEIGSMAVNDSLFYDTDRNATFNRYPLAYHQFDPLTSIKFKLNGKEGTAYHFLYPRISAETAHCDRAFVIVPGNGPNTATELVLGSGQYNELCFVLSNLRKSGDVYAVMKPNEDARALYWNKHKIDHDDLVSLLIPQSHRYGLNYLVELIATIRHLKQKYSQVVLLGAAEGGYASLMASIVAHPDATVISGGYTIAFDTSLPSFNILSQKFDSLVSFYDRNTIKNSILAGNTQYLFAWGDQEPIVLIQDEHDHHYTENFFNDTTRISCHYNFTGHTFPYCSTIDSFLSKKASVPPLAFSILSTNGKIMMKTLVQNCAIAKSRFDLYKNGSLYRSYDFHKGDTILYLVDSGIYYLRNIRSVYGERYVCADSVYFDGTTNKPLYFDIQYNNPVTAKLIVKANMYGKPRRYELFDLYGNCKCRIETADLEVEFQMGQHPAGVYVLKVTEAANSVFARIIKI